MKRLPVLLYVLLISAPSAFAWERFDSDEGYKKLRRCGFKRMVRPGEMEIIEQVLEERLQVFGASALQFASPATSLE